MTSEFENGERPPWMWLCLSGGGFRAALFHYGCLKRLHELGLLGYGYAYSATSGGALVTALLACSRGAKTIDRERGTQLHDWESFERTLLSLATRGILGPVALLAGAYSLYLIAALCALWAPPRAAVPGIAGLLLHLALAVGLLVEGAHRHSIEEQVRSEMNGEPDPGILSRVSLGRLLLALVSPSYLRLMTLNVRAFRWQRLSDILSRPKIYLTALDLNDGTEKVFTQGVQGVLTDLSALGCRELWEQRSARGRDVPDVEIASAVAASTAIPPVFRPVTVRSRGRVAGVFVDGGVVDNFATNVPKALATHIHRLRGQRYDGGPGSLPSFQESTGCVAILDGSRYSPREDKAAWRYPKALFRIVSLLSNQQAEDMQLTAWTLDRLAGTPALATGLRVGFPDGSPFAVLNPYISRVRTHLDAFSPMECAALAYCGYLCAEELVPNFPTLRGRVDPEARSPLGSFEEILPSRFRPVRCALDDLERHLRYSHLRLGLLRWLARELSSWRL